ncbi:MAG: hypothetical protein ACE5WD_01140 [Candidatus Aminicenantia bacterium]
MIIGIPGGFIYLIVGIIFSIYGVIGVSIILLLLAILLDSKERIGKPSWGISIGSLALFFIIVNILLRVLMIDDHLRFDSWGLSILFVSFCGSWFGMFFLYRLLTKKRITD